MAHRGRARLYLRQRHLVLRQVLVVTLLLLHLLHLFADEGQVFAAEGAFVAFEYWVFCLFAEVHVAGARLHLRLYARATERRLLQHADFWLCFWKLSRLLLLLLPDSVIFLHAGNELLWLVEFHFQVAIFQWRYFLRGVLINVLHEELSFGLRKAIIEYFVVVHVLHVYVWIWGEPILRVQLIFLLNFVLLVEFVCNLLRVLLRDQVNCSLLLLPLLLCLSLMLALRLVHMHRRVLRLDLVVMNGYLRLLSVPEIFQIKSWNGVYTFFIGEWICAWVLFEAGAL